MEKITDSLGRVLEVKKPSPIERMRLIRACGAAADIQVYLGNANVSFFVRSIDGVPMPSPKKVEDVDALFERVGDEGIAAVAEWVGTQPDALDVSAAKNSPASPSS